MDPVIFTEWSRYSAKHNDVPPITELEEFALECKRLLDRVHKTKTTGRQQPTPQPTSHHGQGTRSLGEKSVLPTFKVQVVGKGVTVMARGFVDTGSAISCVTSRLATSIKANHSVLIIWNGRSIHLPSRGNYAIASVQWQDSSHTHVCSCRRQNCRNLTCVQHARD